MSNKENDKIMEYIVEQYLEDCESMSPQKAQYMYWTRLNESFPSEADRVSVDPRY